MAKRALRRQHSTAQHSAPCDLLALPVRALTGWAAVHRALLLVLPPHGDHLGHCARGANGRWAFSGMELNQSKSKLCRYAGVQPQRLRPCMGHHTTETEVVCSC